MLHEVVDFTDVWIGKYHFRKRLGVGGSATVWLADETSPSRSKVRPVAIKVFIDQTTDKASFTKTLRSFQVDIQHLAELDHSNPIIQYHNSEIVDITVDAKGKAATITDSSAERAATEVAVTALLIVMEYADGGAVGLTYRNEVIVDRDDMGHIGHFIDICRGLQAAHNRGTIHRDIKPGNLLWFRKIEPNLVKIGDFGIAEHLDAFQADDGWSFSGTPDYMSPESFHPGSQATPERDIYALGCTFYEIVTGEPAFNPADLTIDGFRNVHENAPRPDAVTRSPDLISVGLSGIFKRMMAIEADSRPSLDQVIQGLTKEKRNSFDPSAPVSIEETQLPEEPVYCSEYVLHPQFRRQQLKESPFFVFVSVEGQSEYRYRGFFALLRLFFGSTFSICEVFGRWDFIVRVWSKRDHVAAFCERVINEFLDGDQSSLRVLACDERVYLGVPKRVPDQGPSLPEVLVKINDVQTGKSQRTIKEATDWLVKHRIFLAKVPDATSGNRARCFCLVSHAGPVSDAERQATAALISKQLEDSLSVKRFHLSVHRRAYKPMDDLDEGSSYLISYVAPTINDVSKVPGVIANKLATHRLRSTTLVASKRYYIESHRVASH